MPTLIFGEGVGQIGGTGKDTIVNEGAVTTSHGADITLTIRTRPALDIVGLVSFIIGGYIPTNAIVNSSVYSGRTSNFAGAANMSVSRLLLPWGITPINAGPTQTPAALGQPTWDNSYDFNGGGDVPWTGGVFNIAADADAAEDVQAFAGLGNLTNFNILPMTRLWIANPGINYGFAITSSVIANNAIHSEEAVVAANRPFLTINYTVPPSAGQSRISIPVSISIG